MISLSRRLISCYTSLLSFPHDIYPPPSIRGPTFTHLFIIITFILFIISRPVREARTLAAYDVRLQGSRLTCKIEESSKISIELLPLEACPPPDDALPENGTTGRARRSRSRWRGMEATRRDIEAEKGMERQRTKDTKDLHG